MGKLAILCVDDESIILNSLLRQLQTAFDDLYLYETAENAEEALEIIAELQDEQTDLLVIVSDWLMPGTKGDELLIQVHNQFPGVVKIMLTGQADQAAVQRANSEANLHACLAKPWNEQELVAMIQSAIQKL
ncbi:MAG: response regulator [Cyanobacteria bacterium P01_F01_bin.42]